MLLDFCSLTEYYNLFMTLLDSLTKWSLICDRNHLFDFYLLVNAYLKAKFIIINFIENDSVCWVFEVRVLSIALELGSHPRVH